MNRGDTNYLLLDFTVNGSPMEENAYDEIEFQINQQSMKRQIKKLLSKGEIEWGTYTWTETVEGTDVEHSFTGYACHLSQEDTFTLSAGANKVQLRILADGEVASSKWLPFDVGDVLSNEVLKDVV